MLARLLKFKRRNTMIDVVERTNHELTMKRDYHRSNVAALEAEIEYLTALKREHMVAQDAINDALMSLGVAETIAVPHIVLARDIYEDIEAARSLTRIEYGVA